MFIVQQTNYTSCWFKNDGSIFIVSIFTMTENLFLLHIRLVRKFN